MTSCEGAMHTNICGLKQPLTAGLCTLRALWEGLELGALRRGSPTGSRARSALQAAGEGSHSEGQLRPVSSAPAPDLPSAVSPSGVLADPQSCGLRAWDSSRALISSCQENAPRKTQP